MQLRCASVRGRNARFLPLPLPHSHRPPDPRARGCRRRRVRARAGICVNSFHPCASSDALCLPSAAARLRQLLGLTLLYFRGSPGGLWALPYLPTLGALTT